MIAKLQSPILAAGMAILLSVGVGAYLSMRVLTPLLEKALLVPEFKAPTELKQRGWDFWTIEVDNLSNALKEERARMRQQGELLDLRLARVAAEEKELAKVRAEIERLRQEIASKVTEIGTDEAKNIRMLSQTYSTLTPSAVVAIFKELDDVTVVKVMALMKADNLGPIFEEMAKSSGKEGTMARRAAMLSEKLRLMKSSKPAGSS